MKRLEIVIMRSSDALNAAIDTWHMVEGLKGVTPRLSFGSIRDLFSAITEKKSRRNSLPSLDLVPGINSSIQRIAASHNYNFQTLHGYHSQPARR